VSTSGTDALNGLPLVFHEEFDSGCARWEFTDPEAWRIGSAGGDPVLELCKSSDYTPPVRSPHSIALIKGLDLTDFVLEARMNQTGREYGHRDMCIFFGHNDPAHFYYVHIATKADANANSVFIVNGKPRTSIASERTDGTDWGEGEHLVRLERCAASGHIAVFFDDMDHPIMKACDTTFTFGRVGFGSFDDTGTIDGIRIWARKAD
jgi:hypothetical protein